MADIIRYIYIGQAQGDNLSRSKATKDGIYGTASQGKRYNKAPRGYKNKHRVDANGMVIEKYVEFSEEAKSIRKAFEEFAKGTISADYARRRYCPRVLGRCDSRSSRCHLVVRNGYRSR